MGSNFRGTLLGAVIVCVLAEGAFSAVTHSSANNDFDNHINTTEKEEVKDNVSRIVFSLQPAIDFGNETSLQGLLNVWQQVLGRDEMKKMEFDTMLDEVQKKIHPIEARIAFYVALFPEIRRRGIDSELHNMINFANHMEFTMSETNYGSVSSEMKYRLEKIKSKLPQLVKSIVFSNTICIKNKHFGEYLFASTDLLQPLTTYGASQRYAYTAVSNEMNKSSEFKWKVQFLEVGKVMLKNVAYNEPLYSEYLTYPELNDKPRDVFTRNHAYYFVHADRQDNWEIEEIAGSDSVRFKNLLFRDEYLHVSTNGTMAKNKRRVHIGLISNTSDQKAFNWDIVDCP